MECRIFARLETHLTIRFSRKNQLKRTGTAIIMLYICLTAKCELFRSIMNFKNFKNYLDFMSSQPAVKPGSARCTAPEIQHNKANPVAFTKLLFRGRFTQCTMVILLYFLSLPFFTFFSIDWNA